MSPTVLFRLFLCILAASAAMFIASLVIPDRDLSYLEDIPAKRFLTCSLAIAVATSAFIVYRAVVLPNPARLIHTLIYYVLPILGSGIVFSAARPNVTAGRDPATGWHLISLTWGEVNGWSIALGVVLVIFVYMMVLAYPAHYDKYVSNQ